MTIVANKDWMLLSLEDPAARSQFRSLCYRQISARIGNAVAKATVMRLLSIPRLPVPLPVDRTLLARNCPGPADSFSPSCPSSLSSLVYSSSQSPALSPSLTCSFPLLFFLPARHTSLVLLFLLISRAFSGLARSKKIKYIERLYVWSPIPAAGIVHLLTFRKWFKQAC